jgi:hypothetical protein
VGEEQLVGDVSSIVHCGRECAENKFLPLWLWSMDKLHKKDAQKERGRNQGCSLKLNF